MNQTKQQPMKATADDLDNLKALLKDRWPEYELATFSVGLGCVGIRLDRSFKTGTATGIESRFMVAQKGRRDWKLTGDTGK